MIVIEPNGGQKEVTISTTPFRIGRQAGNELTLRDGRISRQQSQIIIDHGKYVIEDVGSRHGTFINGQKTIRHELKSKDAIDFGIPDSFKLIFVGEEASLEELLQRVETTPPAESTSRELYHLGVLLEVARVLHTGMSLEDVLTSVVDAAIQVTKTERGVLLLRNQESPDPNALEATVARDSRHTSLSPEALEISSSVLKQVVQTRRELVVSDSADEQKLREQASVVRLALRTVVAIPLEKLPVMGSLDTTAYGRPTELLGVLYLDSHAAVSAFSQLDREVLRSLALEAATVVENVRLFAAVRAKERMEHEMSIACEIQQQLLPTRFPQAAHFSMIGRNIACESVGGDYFDVIDLAGGRYGFVVADVSGKGVTAAILASMLQGVFSATAGMDIPLQVLASRVNKYLCERSADDRYATLFYGVLDTSGRIDYINAGHIPPLVRTSLGQVYRLASDNFPLGMFDFAEYRSDRAVLQPGDFMIICTDGFSEAHNLRDELFGEAGMRDILQRFNGQTVEELNDAIQAGVREFTEGAAQSDDMTLVIIHYRGAAAETAQKEPQTASQGGTA